METQTYNVQSCITQHYIYILQKTTLVTGSTCTDMPQSIYLDEKGQVLPEGAIGDDLHATCSFDTVEVDPSHYEIRYKCNDCPEGGERRFINDMVPLSLVEPSYCTEW